MKTWHHIKTFGGFGHIHGVAVEIIHDSFGGMVLHAVPFDPSMSKRTGRQAVDVPVEYHADLLALCRRQAEISMANVGFDGVYHDDPSFHELAKLVHEKSW